MQKNFVYIFSVLLLLFGAYGIFFAQKIPIANGMGWDGALYVEYVQQWPDPLVNHELPPYYLKKIFLPAILHYTCSIQAALQGISMRDFPADTILRYFDFFNLIFLCLFFFLLYKIFVKVFGNTFLSQPWWFMLWAGSNFFIIKMTFYYPALLDTFACMLGALLLYGHLSKKNYWILIGMAAGYFTHPFLFLTGALLLIWPDEISSQRKLPQLTVWVLLPLIAALLAYGLYEAYLQQPDWVRPPEQHLIWLSGICAVAYLCYILHVSELIREGVNYLFHIRWANLLLVTVLYIMLAYVVQVSSSNQPAAGLLDFLRQIGYDSLQDPMIFVVAQVVYFGPALMVLLFFQQEWKVWLRLQAGGLQLVVWMMLLLTVNNESRQLAVFWPFVVLLLMKVVSRWKGNYLQYLIAVILLVWSRVWLDMHVDEFQNKDYFEFPAQYYFMHQGPWMSVENYYWQAAITLLMSLLIYLYKRQLDRNEKTALAS